MAPLVNAIRRGRPAVLVDCIGHGSSDAPDHVEPYSMNSVVDQILGILGSYPPGHVHLLGYSMGGRIALSMSARAPWYFASITSLSASPGLADAVERARRHDADHALADRIEHDGLESFVDRWLELPMFAPLTASFDDTSRERDRNQRLMNSVVGLANSLRGTGAGSMPPVWNTLPSLRTPLLALAGELDHRYVEIGRSMADLVPHGGVHSIPNSGHALHVENPSVVAPIIAEFLEGCESDAAP